MVDSRQMINEPLYFEIQNDNAIKELLMKNWISFKELREIISNIVQLKITNGEGFYGNFRMTNEMFLGMLRKKYSNKLQKTIGLINKSNRKVISDLEVISTYFGGIIFFIFFNFKIQTKIKK